VVAVFDADEHPRWGDDGSSAEEALEHARTRVNEKLGSAGLGEVRHTVLRNHSVKCFLDDKDDPDAFTVDVTPALLREDGGFWIPEKSTQKWIASDPQFLIDVVAKRHDEWNGTCLAAAENGKRVRYTTCAQLANELTEAKDENHLSRVVTRPIFE
jgi:hypothetical protein